MLRPLENLIFVANADYGWEGVRSLESDGTTKTQTAKWWGGMVAAHYQYNANWGLALRGEYLADVEGHVTNFKYSNEDPVRELELASATPDPRSTTGGEPDPSPGKPWRFRCRRAKSGGGYLRQRVTRDASDQVFTTTLSVVATTP